MYQSHTGNTEVPKWQKAQGMSAKMAANEIRTHALSMEWMGFEPMPNQNIALRFDARLFGDVTHLALQENCFAWNQRNRLVDRNDKRACLVCERSRVRFPKAEHILHSVANGSPPLQHLRRYSYVFLAICRRDGHPKLVTRFGVIWRV